MSVHCGDDGALEFMDEAPLVIMACCYQANKIGVAAYHHDTGEIHVVQSVDESQGPLAFQMFQLAKLHAQPTEIHLSSKSDEAFLQAARIPVPGQSAEIVVRKEKSSIFTYEQGIQRLQALHVHGMPRDPTPHGRLDWINAKMNLSLRHQVQAAGALIAVMQKEGISQLAMEGSDLEWSDGTTIQVKSISEIGISGHLMMDPLTLRGLQVFQEERHPSVMGIGQTKEGFSVFGMFNRCVTTMGSRLLRLWFLRPLVHLEVINDRLATIESLVSSSDIISTIRSTIKGVKDPSRLLSRLQSTQGRHKASDFFHFCESLDKIMQLRTIFEELSGHQEASLNGYSESAQPPTHIQWSRLSISCKVLTHVTADLHKCRSLVKMVLDSGGMKNDIQVVPGVCQDLDRLKHMYNGLPDILTKVMESELRRVPRELLHTCKRQLWSIVNVPQIGHMVQVTGQLLGAHVLDALPDYVPCFESTSDDGSPVHYYKCTRTEELDKEFGDIHNKIHDWENSICAELVARLSAYTTQIQWATSVCAEVDCLTALALCAKEGGYCRPMVTQEDRIFIKRGRHVLTEMLVHAYIPNDTDMGRPSGKLHVVTGPNAAGKSCYLKQVALMVFLSHVGSFVPAEECVVGVTDRIFSRLCSIREGQQYKERLDKSLFAMDMMQMAQMMTLATPRSLLIIDEFGKGTLTSDGVGLLCSMLHWWSKQPDPPRIIACTHFSEVLDEQYLPRCPQVQFLTMHMVTKPMSASKGDRHCHKDCVPLYKLVPGYCTPSFGVQCARSCGVPEDVLERAIGVINAHTQGRNLLALKDPNLDYRDEVCIKIVKSLLGIPADDTKEVLQLLEDVRVLVKSMS